ncbi:hypothetical protein A6R68_08166, partial [Neotoma lepida]
LKHEVRWAEQRIASGSQLNLLPEGCCLHINHPQETPQAWGWEKGSSLHGGWIERENPYQEQNLSNNSALITLQEKLNERKDGSELSSQTARG